MNHRGRWVFGGLRVWAVRAWVLAGMLVPAGALDLADVLPALRSMPAPPSITEGVRLSYRVEVATVPSAYIGKWVDNAGTTNSYDIPSPSGRGVTQVDVVGVSPQWVGLRVQPWLNSDYTGPLVPLFGADESLVSAAGGGDWYAHPAVLATVAPVLTTDLKILRMPLRVAGRWYDALRVQSSSPAGLQVVSYDLQTGYLIYKAAAVTGEQGVTVSQASYLGSRVLPDLWGAASLTPWLAAAPVLRYEGVYTSVAPGPYPFTLPLSADLEVTARGGRWFVYRQTTTLGSLPGLPPSSETKVLVGGVRDLLPLGLALPLPAGLQVGQRLDVDEMTGAVLTVVRVGALAEGGTGLALRLSVGDVAWSETVYDDRHGLAVGWRTYSGASPVYYTASELRLATTPPTPPAAPRLLVERRVGAPGLVLVWSTEADRRYRVECTLNGGRSWEAEGGTGEVRGTGGTVRRELAAPSSPACYRVGVW